MKTHVTIACLALLASSTALAQFRSVAPDGSVTFSDTPPTNPATRVSVQDLPVQPMLVAAASLPYALSQASSRYPVTLYTSAPCAGCDSARSYLKQRGVPFNEKTVVTDADIAALKKITGGANTIPVITVGSLKSVGFQQSTVAGQLDDAGYPATSTLPRDYVYPAPTTLTSPAPAPADASPSAAPAPATSSAPAPIPQPPPATGNAPPGFKF